MKNKNKRLLAIATMAALCTIPTLYLYTGTITEALIVAFSISWSACFMTDMVYSSYLDNKQVENGHNLENNIEAIKAHNAKLNRLKFDGLVAISVAIMIMLIEVINKGVTIEILPAMSFAALLSVFVADTFYMKLKESDVSKAIAPNTKSEEKNIDLEKGVIKHNSLEPEKEQQKVVTLEANNNNNNVVIHVVATNENTSLINSKRTYGSLVTEREREEKKSCIII